jgi:hypothetical protein
LASRPAPTTVSDVSSSIWYGPSSSANGASLTWVTVMVIDAMSLPPCPSLTW